MKELLGFGASFGRVYLRWNFPLLQCSSHWFWAVPIYVLMKFLDSNKSTEKLRNLSLVLLLSEETVVEPQVLFPKDLTPETGRSKTWRCDDVLCPEMPCLLLRVVLNLGANFPDRWRQLQCKERRVKCLLVDWLIYWYNWVCNTQTINMIKTGWHVVFLFSRNFKILSLPKMQPRPFGVWNICHPGGKCRWFQPCWSGVFEWGVNGRSLFSC